jgi:hypothetical protein
MKAFDRAPTQRVKAVYAHLDSLLLGIEKLKAAGLEGYDVLSPLPRHEILEAVYEGAPSPVRWWTLSGAVLGLCAGFALPALTHSQWPMINPGGKPVVSLIPFAVIMFESTILMGSLATFAGMIFHCGLPSFFVDKSLQDPRMSDASFGIVFTGAPLDEVGFIRSILEGTGAVEITEGDDTVYEVSNV